MWVDRPHLGDRSLRDYVQACAPKPRRREHPDSIDRSLFGWLLRYAVPLVVAAVAAAIVVFVAVRVLVPGSIDCSNVIRVYSGPLPQAHSPEDDPCPEQNP